MSLSLEEKVENDVIRDLCYSTWDSFKSQINSSIRTSGH